MANFIFANFSIMLCNYLAFNVIALISPNLQFLDIRFKCLYSSFHAVNYDSSSFLYNCFLITLLKLFTNITCLFTRLNTRTSLRQFQKDVAIFLPFEWTNRNSDNLQSKNCTHLALKLKMKKMQFVKSYWKIESKYNSWYLIINL